MDNTYTPIAIFNVLFVQYKLDKSAYDTLTSLMKRKITSYLLERE
ncbi:hypothetical protein [Clostridium neonatale]